MTYECDDCGRGFDTERGLNIHESTGHTKPYQDKEVLERLYNEEGLNQREIGEKFGVDRVTILRWMDRLDIETDDPADPTRPPNHHFFNRPDRPIGNEYERVRTTIDGNMYTVKIHRLLAVACGKLDSGDLFNKDIIVHHESGHGLDNRPGNLEAMGHGEHTKLHNDMRRLGKG